MQVTVIRNLEGLQTLADEWRRLAASAASPLLDYEWCVSGAEALHAEADLRVVTVHDGGGLVAAAPLAIDRTAHSPHLVLIGATALYEPGGWLWQSATALQALIDGVRDLGQPLLLHRIDAGGALAEAIAALHPARAVVRRRETAPSLAVDTRGDWETYYAGLSSTITSNLPRVRRKAERVHGAMVIDQLQPAPADVPALLDAFMAVERSGWKGEKGSAMADRPEMRQFFTSYCQRIAARGQLRCAQLRLGAQVAAMEISVEAYQRAWQLKIGYHADVAAYYPGLHLTQSSVQRAFAAGLEAYEFLGVAESWEERWQPVTRRYETMLAYPLTMSGLFGAGRDLLGIAWQRATTQRHG